MADGSNQTIHGWGDRTNRWRWKAHLTWKFDLFLVRRPGSDHSRRARWSTCAGRARRWRRASRRWSSAPTRPSPTTTSSTWTPARCTSTTRASASSSRAASRATTPPSWPTDRSSTSSTCLFSSFWPTDGSSPPCPSSEHPSKCAFAQCRSFWSRVLACGQVLSSLFLPPPFLLLLPLRSIPLSLSLLVWVLLLGLRTGPPLRLLLLRLLLSLFIFHFFFFWCFHRCFPPSPMFLSVPFGLLSYFHWEFFFTTISFSRPAF